HVRAVLDADSIEHRRESKRWLEDADRKASEVIALGARWDRYECPLAMKRGNFSADGNDGDGSSHLLHTFVVIDVDEGLRQRLGVHAAGIGPDDSFHPDHYTRSYPEERRDELLQQIIFRWDVVDGGPKGDGGNSGGSPKADEAHFRSKARHQRYPEDIPKASLTPRAKPSTRTHRLPCFS